MAEFTVERRGSVTHILIDNPKVGNALSRGAAQDMATEFEAISYGDGKTRAVLLTSKGKHFCTGADVSGSRVSGERPVVGHMVRGLAGSHHRLVEAVFNCKVPVVSAVRGAAMGAGMNLALATDFVIASNDAFFHAPFVERGFGVDSGGSWLLPRLVGMTRAKHMLYMSKKLDAPTALDWGLIYDVTDLETLDEAAENLVNDLSQRATQAISTTKRLLHDSTQMTIGQAMHAESMAVELNLRSNDFKEGMRAFVEKRPTNFDGS